MIARIILLCFGTAVLASAFIRLRRYRIKERHMLLFMFVGLPFLALAVWPWAVGWLALRLGIEYYTVSILCLAAFLMVMVFELLTIVSLQERKISTLAQLVGIMMEKQGMAERAGAEKPSPPPPAKN